VIVFAVLLIKIKIEIIAVQNDITVNIIFFGFIKFTRKYVIKREKETYLALYYIKKKRNKKVTTLKEIVKKAIKNDLPDITLIKIIKLFLQYRTREGNKGYSYIYKRMKYIIRAFFRIGTGDAYSSAMLCGFLGAVSSALCASRNNKAHRTIVNLSPEFSKQEFFVRVNCIIVIAPANIIIGYLISKKNEAVRKNASDRKYNADCDV
jgi:hypothetical protein